MGKDNLVFIVDDENIILSLIEYVIGNKPGIRLKTFSSVDQCLAALSMNPDMIVTDHHFGRQGDDSKTGLELLRTVRKVSEKLPVLVLSAHEDPLLKEQYEKEGVTEYITKNEYFVDELEEAIRKHLNLG